MEEILDHEIESVKDERVINRITAFARYVFCAYVCYLIISTLIADSTGTFGEAVAYKAGTIIGVLFVLPFFYYNIRHANIERVSNYVYPLFRRPFIIIFLFYSCYLLFICAKSAIDNLIYFNSFPDEYFYVLVELIVGNIIAIVTLAWILYREFVYLKRIPKLQNTTRQ